MFKKHFFTIAIVVFVMVNTLYFWEGILGLFVIFALLAIILTFVILLFQVSQQMLLSIKERFTNKMRLYKIAIVILLLTLMVLRPYGIINYGALESKSVLIAEQEGSANCMTTLMLKESGRFKIRSVCFGVYDEMGFYTLHNDTIKFSYQYSRNNNSYRFGILDSAKKNINMYRSVTDTSPYPLYVSKNQLKRLK